MVNGKPKLSTIVQTIYRGILGLGFFIVILEARQKEERKTKWDTNQKENTLTERNSIESIIHKKHIEKNKNAKPDGEHAWINLQTV